MNHKYINWIKCDLSYTIIWPHLIDHTESIIAKLLTCNENDFKESIQFKFTSCRIEIVCFDTGVFDTYSYEI